MADLDKIKTNAEKEILSIATIQELENWRVKYLGRKSELSSFFDSLKDFPLEERKEKGKQANMVRKALFSIYGSKKNDLEKRQLKKQYLDITRPGDKVKRGHLHPLTLVTRQIVSVFEKMGFAIVEGPEIETEYYNFDALNIPAGHPARDMWDTLWLRRNKKKEINSQFSFLLRTHTSPEQIRYMKTHEPPFRIIAPGRCFRHEATDSSHEIQFHQIEGLMVGEEITLANFKAVIESVTKSIFQDKVLIRFRPSYFPFVTPGIEVDIKLKKALSGIDNNWMEIMGAGMVHPFLFKEVGYVSNRWQGFAFGLGIERIAMIKYHINDIRLFFNPDLRFLEQF